MSGATRMGVPEFALDVRKGVGVLLFGPEGQTVFVICSWTGVCFNEGARTAGFRTGRLLSYK